MNIPWTTADIYELVKVLATVCTAAAAVVGVQTARAGLTKWRSESLGKRKTELAEQVLSGAYEVRDAFMWVRTPAFGGREGESRPPEGNESDALRKLRNDFFIPIERLNNSREVFAKLQALRYTVGAHFGQDAMKPLAALLEARRAIVSAASLLITNAHFAEDHAAAHSLVPLREALGWSDKRPDKLDEQVEAAVAAVEAFCRPVLSERPNK
ncbi:MAG TPA: hypothetical protein VFA75_19610 [Nevskia sp.]|nr:hypothetical protein [Nevskia sp.]